MNSTTIDKELLSLPIDQYSRQKWAATLIEQLRGKEKLTILDVGGYKGKTHEFHPNDSVTVCDLYDVEESNYVKGDGRKLPFKSNEFDFVVTFDTYEHVPREGREIFVKELARVAKEGVVLAAPFDNESGSVFQAEMNLNDYYKKLYDNDHPWLKEHIEYRIPERSEIESLLKKLELDFVSLASNELSMWVLMQTLYFSIEIDEDFRGRVDDVNRFYNHSYLNLDITEDHLAYRHIYFISKKQQYVDQIRDYIHQRRNITDENEKVHFMAYALSVFGVKYRDVELYKKYLEVEVEKFKARAAELEKHIQQLDRENKNLYQRARHRLGSAKRTVFKKHKN